MRTTRMGLVAAALWLTTASAIFAAGPQMGTWKLNESKSKFSSPTRNTTVTYTDAEGGMTKVDVVGVGSDGKPIHWVWVGKFDGHPYKVEGDPIADTITYEMVNGRTNRLTLMKDGKVVASGTVKVAKNGKSRTVMTTITSADGKKMTDMAYYDKE